MAIEKNQISVQPLLDSLLQEVKDHPAHNLLPRSRQRVYKTFRNLSGVNFPEELYARLPQIDKYVTYLEHLSAKKVVKIWNDLHFLWRREQDQEREELSIEGDLAMFMLPSFEFANHFLKLSKNNLQRKTFSQKNFNETMHYWYVMGNIDEEIFYWQKTTMDMACGFDALQSAYAALYSAFFPPRFEIYDLTDEENNDEFLIETLNFIDSAGHACRAITGVGEFERNQTESPQFRLHFWTWWLTEAIPQAIKFGDKNHVIR